MIRILYSDPFLRAIRKTPRAQQEKLAALVPLLQKDPFHPKLHTKPLGGAYSGFYSFRITHDWRVIFQFNAPNQVTLLEAGHRKDVYR